MMQWWFCKLIAFLPGQSPQLYFSRNLVISSSQVLELGAQVVQLLCNAHRQPHMKATYVFYTLKISIFTSVLDYGLP